MVQSADTTIIPTHLKERAHRLTHPMQSSEDEAREVMAKAHERDMQQRIAILQKKCQKLIVPIMEEIRQEIFDPNNIEAQITVEAIERPDNAAVITRLQWQKPAQKTGASLYKSNQVHIGVTLDQMLPSGEIIKSAWVIEEINTLQATKITQGSKVNRLIAIYSSQATSLHHYDWESKVRAAIIKQLEINL